MASSDNTLAPAGLTVREQGRRARPRRVLVPCPRRLTEACKGSLYLEADFGGHLFSLKCHQCERSAGDVTAFDLEHTYGMSWRDIELASWHAVPFLCVVLPVEVLA